MLWYKHMDEKMLQNRSNPFNREASKPVLQVPDMGWTLVRQAEECNILWPLGRRHDLAEVGERLASEKIHRQEESSPD